MKQQATFRKTNTSDLILPLALGCLLLINPFFVDVQVSRPKLLIIELGTFSLLLIFLLRVIISGKLNLNPININIPIIIYIAYISVLYIVSGNKSVAENEFKRMLLCSAIFFIAANSITSGTENILQRGFILTGFVIGSCASAIYGLMQHWGQFWIFIVPKFDRVYSTYGNPIFFAAHLVIFLPVLLGFIFSLKKKLFLVKVILFALFLCGVLALYFTFTRAAWIGFIASLTFFGIINLKSKKARIVFLCSAGAAAVIFLIVTWGVWLRHQAHPLIWKDSLRMWSDYPVFGTGIGTFHINFPKYASDELLKIWPQKERIVNDAHNEYVQILSETGLVGFGVFLWIVYSFFSFGLKQRDRNLPLIAGFISSGVAILIQNFFSVDMRFIISAYYFFLVVGLLFSYNQNRVEKEIPIKGTFRTVLIFIVLFIFGVFGFGKSLRAGGVEFNLLQILHFDFKDAKLSFEPSAKGTGLLAVILKPYIAQKRLSREVSFFDEKVLEPYKTIADLEALVKAHPEQAAIYEKLGWVYSKEKNFPKAIENYEKAVRINPASYGSYNNLGNISFLTGQRLKAIEYYKKSISIKTDQVDAHTNLGITYYYEGRLQEAAAEFNTVLKIDPNNEKAIVMLKKMRE